MALDKRVDWLQAKACVALGVDDGLFNSLLQDPDEAKKFSAFLDGGTGRAGAGRLSRGLGNYEATFGTSCC